MDRIITHDKNEQLVEWGVASLPLPGQILSGDSYIVRSLVNGILAGVVDGLGHGDEAADAAKIAIATLKVNDPTSLSMLIIKCHEALQRTRGVVLSLALFSVHDSTMTWLGVGNIEGVLLRTQPENERETIKIKLSRENLLLRSGVVGYHLPPLRLSSLPVSPGDTLIFATDGINSGFTEDITLSDSPEQIAHYILTQHSKGTDDALVLVVRWIGTNRKNK